MCHILSEFSCWNPLSCHLPSGLTLSASRNQYGGSKMRHCSKNRQSPNTVVASLTVWQVQREKQVKPCQSLEKSPHSVCFSKLLQSQPANQPIGVDQDMTYCHIYIVTAAANTTTEKDGDENEAQVICVAANQRRSELWQQHPCVFDVLSQEYHDATTPVLPCGSLALWPQSLGVDAHWWCSGVAFAHWLRRSHDSECEQWINPDLPVSRCTCSVRSAVFMMLLAVRLKNNLSVSKWVWNEPK